MKDKSIGLIKWRKAGLENLLVSTCIKRRIRGMAKKDYRRDEHKNSSSSFNFAPTKSEDDAISEVDNYG